MPTKSRLRVCDFVRLTVCLLLVFTGCLAAQAEPLRSPWDNLTIKPTDVAYHCPDAPAFASTIRADSYYIDANASVIDPKKYAAFQAASAGPTELSQKASLAADAWLTTGSREAARCVFTLLNAAAKAGAWDGLMPSFQGSYVQNWLLSGTGIAYLKVRGSGQGTAAEEAAIKAWLGRLSLRVRAYFDPHIAQRGSDAWNNHMNWAGLAVAAAAIADDDHDGASWALRAYQMGVAGIQPDGSLPSEMWRAGRALHYHLYALGPLVLLAEFGEANGGGLYAENSGAIHRLVHLCTAGLKDPGVFERRTGVKQVTAEPLSGTDIGWAVPYMHRFPDTDLSALLAKASGTRASSWGGLPPE